MNDALLEWLVRGSAVLAIAVMAVRLLPASRPDLRHGVWTLALALQCSIPLLSGCLPVLPAASPEWTTPGEESLDRVDERRAGATTVPTRPSEARAIGRMDLRLPWLVGGLIALALHVRARRRLARSLQCATPLVEGAARDLLVRSAFPRPAPRLVVSDAARVPFTAGVLRPVVVLPADHPRWSCDTLHAALAHELAHVRRRDCLWQGVGNVVGVLLWWNPLVHLARRRQSGEAELAADRMACASEPRILPSRYVDALLEVAGRGGVPTATAGWGGAPGGLRRRAAIVLEPPRDEAPRGAALVRRLIVVGGLVLVPCLVGSAPAGDDPRVDFLDELATEVERAERLRELTLPPQTLIRASERMTTDSGRAELLRRAARAGAAVSPLPFLSAVRRMRSDAARVDCALLLLEARRLDVEGQRVVCELAHELRSDASRERLLLGLLTTQECGTTVRAAVAEAARSITRPAARERVLTAAR